MAKGLTKTQLIRVIAEKLEVSDRQSSAFFAALADTAVKETKKNGEFTIPGLGKLVKAERQSRSTGFLPQTRGPAKSVRQIVKERAAALDAGAPVISIEELDGQLMARAPQQQAARRPGPTVASRRASAVS